jgi:hypothetical protein
MQPITEGITMRIEIEAEAQAEEQSDQGACRQARFPSQKTRFFLRVRNSTSEDGLTPQPSKPPPAHSLEQNPMR